MKHKVLILNGPGLRDLSDFDGDTYAGITLQELRKACSDLCRELGLDLEFRQTEDQDEMFRWIAHDSEDFDGVVINPAGDSRAASVPFPVYRPAIEMIAKRNKAVVEVHLNNIFTGHAPVSQRVDEPGGEMGLVCGLGINSYLLAIRALAHRFSKNAAGA